MFGLGNNDEEERFWNFALFKFYGTDKELDEASPIFIVVLLLCAVGGLIWWAAS